MRKGIAESLIASGHSWTIEELDGLFETTTTGNIAVVPTRMGGISPNDLTMGRRKKVWAKRHTVNPGGISLKNDPSIR